MLKFNMDPLEGDQLVPLARGPQRVSQPCPWYEDSMVKRRL